MRMNIKQKGFICLLTILILVSYILVHSFHKREKSLYEIDLYDDGDYDEKERIRSTKVKWQVSYRDKGWMRLKPTRKVLPKPTPLSPQIVIQDLNKDITILSTTPQQQTEENFFKFLEQKDVLCKQDKRLGSQHDGGWNVCFSPPFGLHKPCIVYSFGIGTSWNFDDAVSKIYGCRVLSFDPSLKDTPDHNRSALITFKKIGIGNNNGTNHKNWRMKTLRKFIHDEGHDNTVIDYVKFDIEFDEWRVLLNILQENALKNVKQIGFEIHTLEFFKFKKNPRLETHSAQGDYLKMFRILKELEKANFRQFNYRLNPFGEFDSKTSTKKRSCCYELHYINMNFVSQKYTVKQSDLTNSNKSSGLGKKKVIH